MDPMVGSGGRRNHTHTGSLGGVPPEEENSNSNVISLLEVCFLCNRRFLYEINLDPSTTQDEHGLKEEDILLHMFFEDISVLEKSLSFLQCCSFCKALCKSMLDAKTALSNVIDEISTFLRRSKKLASSASYILPKTRVINRLYQEQPPSNSSSYLSNLSNLNNIHIQLDAEAEFNNGSNSGFPSQFSAISEVNSPNEVTPHPAPSFSFLSPSKSGMSPKKIKQESPPGDIKVSMHSPSKHSIKGLIHEIGGITTNKIVVVSNTSGRFVIVHDSVPNLEENARDVVISNSQPDNTISEAESETSNEIKPLLSKKPPASKDKKRSKSKNTGKFECDHCAKVFTQRIGLIRHIPMHTGETAYQCDENDCGKKFLHHSSLSHHKLIHSGQKKYLCSICDLRFFTSSHLKRHYRTHTGETPYTCHICQRKFKEKSNLNVHKRVHTKIPAYQCSECSLGFDRRNKLTRHLQKVHQQLLPTEITGI